MENIDEYIIALEKKLTEKKMMERKKEELKNDINSFTDLLPELDSIIEELDQNYQKTKEPQDLEKLNDFLNERKLYELTIQGCMKEYQEAASNLRENEDDYATQEEITSLYYKRRESILKMELLEEAGNKLPDNEISVFQDESGREYKIPREETKKYSEYKDQIIDYDDKIINYTAALDNDLIEEDINVEINTLYTPIENKSKEELEAEYNQVLKELHDIEQSSGRKCHFKTTFNGQKKEVTIPRAKKGKYGSLLTKLHKIEGQLNKYKNNELVVTLDHELYNKMEEIQKIAYLSNLKLQIENLPEAYVMAYINDKYIPMEYKDLYLEVLNLLKPKKKVNYYSIPLDELSLEKKSTEEQMSYYNDLAYNLTQIELVDPVEVSLGSEVFTVNRNDVPLLEKCYARLNKLKETLQQEKEETNQIDRDTHGMKIDEEYVKGLSDIEKKAYYLLFMHDITMKPIENEHIEQANNQTYKFDKKYLDIFNIAYNRYLELVEKEKKPVKVEKKKTAQYLDKIKKSLKKKTVQIGLVVGLMASTFGLGFNMGKNNNTRSQTEISYDQELMNKQINDAVSKAVDEQNIDAIIDNAVKEALEKQSVEPEIETSQEKNFLGEAFILNENANIYSNYNINEPMQPKYKNDVYTTVEVRLQTKDGAIINVNYLDENANEIIKDLMANGAIIVDRSAVAATAVDDYLQKGIVTGTFRESSITPLDIKTDLQEIINESMHQGRGL